MHFPLMEHPGCPEQSWALAVGPRPGHGEAAAECHCQSGACPGPGKLGHCSKSRRNAQQPLSPRRPCFHPAHAPRTRVGFSLNILSPSLGTFVPQDLDVSFYLRAPKAPHFRRMLVFPQLLCSEPPDTLATGQSWWLPPKDKPVGTPFVGVGTGK